MQAPNGSPSRGQSPAAGARGARPRSSSHSGPSHRKAGLVSLAGPRYQHPFFLISCFGSTPSRVNAVADAPRVLWAVKPCKLCSPKNLVVMALVVSDLMARLGFVSETNNSGLL